jgi:hypothetical protein
MAKTVLDLHEARLLEHRLVSVAQALHQLCIGQRLAVAIVAIDVVAGE